MQLTPDIVRHVEGQVMIVVAVRDGDTAAIARSAGARCLADGDIELRLSRQWVDATRAVRPGALIAATFTLPADYRSYQIKGHVTAVTAATADDETAAAGYVAVMVATMTGLGVTLSQLSHTFPATDLLVIRLRPDTLFVQTPGPRAGSAVTDIEA